MMAWTSPAVDREVEALDDGFLADADVEVFDFSWLMRK
jgi:hypothetical protein